MGSEWSSVNAERHRFSAVDLNILQDILELILISSLPHDSLLLASLLLPTAIPNYRSLSSSYTSVLIQGKASAQPKPPIPLEILPLGQFDPVYRSTLDVQVSQTEWG